MRTVRTIILYMMYYDFDIMSIGEMIFNICVDIYIICDLRL